MPECSTSIVTAGDRLFARRGGAWTTGDVPTGDQLRPLADGQSVSHSASATLFGQLRDFLLLLLYGSGTHTVGALRREGMATSTPASRARLLPHRLSLESVAVAVNAHEKPDVPASDWLTAESTAAAILTGRALIR